MAARAWQQLSRLVPSTIGPIGIDFALEAMHLVQFAFSNGHPKVHAHVSVPFATTRDETLNSDLAFRSFVQQALQSEDFRGKKAVMAVPSSLFRTMSINYSTDVGQSDDDAVARHVVDRLEGDFDNYAIDYTPVRSLSQLNEKLALVAISEKSQIVRLLEAARKSGLNVEALEIGPVAIARLVDAISDASGHANVLVVNSGQRGSYLTLLSGGDLLFDQQVNFGESELVRQLAEALEISETLAIRLISDSSAENSGSRAANSEPAVIETLAEIAKPLFSGLADEIKRACLYAAAETRGGSVSQVYLLGGIARWPGSDTLLSSLTNVDITKIPNPLHLFDSSLEATGTLDAPQLAVAAGLALRGDGQ